MHECLFRAKTGEFISLVPGRRLCIPSCTWIRGSMFSSAMGSVHIWEESRRTFFLSYCTPETKISVSLDRNAFRFSISSRLLRCNCEDLWIVVVFCCHHFECHLRFLLFVVLAECGGQIEHGWHCVNFYFLRYRQLDADNVHAMATEYGVIAS